jgi:hypothetical protein
MGSMVSVNTNATGSGFADAYAESGSQTGNKYFNVGGNPNISALTNNPYSIPILALAAVAVAFFYFRGRKGGK